MARQLRIADPELVKQADAADQVYIGKKLFVSVTFDNDEADAKLTPDEVIRVNAALAEKGQRLRGSEVLEYLRVRGKELGLD